jgi:thiamine-monophosphate kinase
LEGAFVRISEFGGEQAIINLIAAKFSGGENDDLLCGIGDDAALIRAGEDRLLVVTTDLLIEGTHFRRDIIDPYSLGWKSIAVNISDIAAMAGSPTYTFTSIALDDVDASFVEALYNGMHDCAATYGSLIVGGDTNVSLDRQAINVTQLGEVSPRRVTLRSTAQIGDRLLVTGTLGDSRAGLEMLLRYGLAEANRLSPSVVEAHLKPKPRIAEAQAAAGTGFVHAMMDISDGLAADLPKLCAASGIGAVIQLNRIPTSEALLSAAAYLEMDPTRLASQGGEDYELLMAVASNEVDQVREAVIASTGTDITEIGVLTDEREVLAKSSDGSVISLSGGWEHFRQGGE